MARSKDLNGAPLDPEDAPGGDRILRTGRREEDDRKGDGWVAVRSLLILVGGTLLVSYLLFSK